MSYYEKCPVCGTISGQLKDHLKRHHGWRYTVDSPEFPVPPIEPSNGDKEKES